jgi:hypothetical protein
MGRDLLEGAGGHECSRLQSRVHLLNLGDLFGELSDPLFEVVDPRPEGIYLLRDELVVLHPREDDPA